MSLCEDNNVESRLPPNGQRLKKQGREGGGHPNFGFLFLGQAFGLLYLCLIFSLSLSQLFLLSPFPSHSATDDVMKIHHEIFGKKDAFSSYLQRHRSTHSKTIQLSILLLCLRWLSNQWFIHRFYKIKIFQLNFTSIHGGFRCTEILPCVYSSIFRCLNSIITPKSTPTIR